MKRILVALDGSQRAPAVLAAAVRLAELTSAKLVLYRAIALVPDIPSELLLATTSAVQDTLVANARDQLSGLADQVRPELIEHIVTELATAWDGICRTARDRDVDLIVLGSHGYGGIDRILGTVAAKVVNHADRNVLVVRTPL